MPKVFVSLEGIDAALKLQDYVNSVPLADVVFTQNGKALYASTEEREEWRFVGLSNWCFAYHKWRDNAPTIS